MPSSSRAFEARTAALAAAATLHGPLRLRPGVDRETTEHEAQLAVRRIADRLAAYLLGTAHLHLIAGPVVDETATAPPGAPAYEGVVMTQMNTAKKFELSIAAADAAGFPTTPNVTWAIDNPDVAELQVAEDEQTCVVVSGTPGSAILTVTIEDENAEGVEPLSVTHAIDVVPAGTATIELVAGEVVDE